MFQHAFPERRFICNRAADILPVQEHRVFLVPALACLDNRDIIKTFPGDRHLYRNRILPGSFKAFHPLIPAVSGDGSMSLQFTCFRFH